MKSILTTPLKTVAIAALIAVSTGIFAQGGQWQVQFGTVESSTAPLPGPAPSTPMLPPPVRPLSPPPPLPPVYLPPTTPAPVQPAIVQAADIVQSIQTQHEQRIRWAAQRGYITEPEYRRLAQMQANIEHNRRIAYADGYFNIQEQQFVYGQLNVLSAEIDTQMFAGNYAIAYFQQFVNPIPVWTLNTGWVNGRYELRADAHHSRGYRPAPQPPVVQPPQQPVPQGHPRHRNHLRDLLEGVFR